MSCHPLIEKALKVRCGYTTIELSQVAFHGAPYTLDVVTHAKVSRTVVVRFSGVTKPFNSTVARSTICDEMT